MAHFLDAQDFLDLRLGLQHEVLGRATAHEEHARLLLAHLRVEHDGRGLVHVDAGVHAQLVAT